MKKIVFSFRLLVLFTTFLFYGFAGQSQEVIIAKWDKYVVATDTVGLSINKKFLAKEGIASNKGIAILTRDAAGTSFKINTDSVAATAGWSRASKIEKYWIATFTTTGYENLKITSKQKGSNTSPRNFKIQYKVGDTATWLDLEGGVIVNANDSYVKGVVKGISLPISTFNQAAVSLRWLCTSDSAIGNTNDTVTPAGVSRLRATITGTAKATTISNDTTLSALSVSAGDLEPIFTSTTNGYLISVPYDTTKVTITATPTNTRATIENGASLVNIPLEVGDTTLFIKVIAEDGVSTGTYTVTVTRKEQGKNTDAALNTLTVSAGQLSPGFTKRNKIYFDTVPFDVETITLTVAANDEKAFIEQINLSDIPLPVGDTTISINVTAEDGVTKATYKVTLTRLPSSGIVNSSANSIKISIYPNPATDLVNIKVNGSGIVEIYNLTGQKIFTKAIANSLSVNQLAKGIYFVKVTTGQGMRTEKLIVK